MRQRRPAPKSKEQAQSSEFFAGVFSADEWREVERQLSAPQPSLELEVGILRVMMRRVLNRLGEDDPAKALPLVRQGVDAICRALRTERLLKGEAADSLAMAFAVALREIGEELGIGEQ